MVIDGIKTITAGVGRREHISRTVVVTGGRRHGRRREDAVGGCAVQRMPTQAVMHGTLQQAVIVAFAQQRRLIDRHRVDVVLRRLGVGKVDKLGEYLLGIATHRVVLVPVEGHAVPGRHHPVEQVVVLGAVGLEWAVVVGTAGLVVDGPELGRRHIAAAGGHADVGSQDLLGGQAEVRLVAQTLVVVQEFLGKRHARRRV